MDAEKKAIWLDALRSGEYSQGAGYLKSAGGFCCIGVASDCAVKDGVGEWRPGHPSGDLGAGYSNYRYSTYVTGSIFAPQVLRWLGFPEGTVHDDVNTIPFTISRDPLPGYLYLTELNDSGMPFEQIADIIDWAF